MKRTCPATVPALCLALVLLAGTDARRTSVASASGPLARRGSNAGDISSGYSWVMQSCGFY